MANENTSKSSDTLSVNTASRSARQHFDRLAAAYGVDRAIARGLRATMKLPQDGMVQETDFVKALKNFTGMSPR